MSRRKSLAVLLVTATVAVGTAFAEDAPLASLPPLPPGPIVVLSDGGILAARLESIDGEGVTVRSPVLGKATLPRSAVRGYHASTAIGPIASQTPDGRTGERAVVRLANGDRVGAAAVSIEAGNLRLDTALPGEREVRIPLPLVRSIDFPAVPPAYAPARRLVALVDGSRFTAELFPSAADVADIVAVVHDGGRVRMLAGLGPVRAREGSGDKTTWPLVRGGTLTGDWPTARGTTAFTGLGIHAPARIRYRLEKPATRLTAQVAIDDSAGQGGSVTVGVVATDASGRSREVHASPILRGGDPLHAIEVGLDGATEIELIVDPADVGSVLDRTIWLDPHVEW